MDISARYILRCALLLPVLFLTGSANFFLLAEAKNEILSEGKTIAAAAEPLHVEEKALTATPAIPVPERGKTWTNGLSMKFVPVGSGSVLFCIWETRRKDFEIFAQSATHDVSANWEKLSFSQKPDEPVANITLAEAEAFCEWLTQSERGKGLLGAKQVYRLPTDAEWCLAANIEPTVGDTLFLWGNDWPPPVGTGNFSTTLSYDRFENTSAAGQFRPNDIGLLDIIGNVWEMSVEPENTDSFFIRGGSWQSSFPEQFSVSFRYRLKAGEHREDIGFRCVLDVSEK